MESKVLKDKKVTLYPNPHPSPNPNPNPNPSPNPSPYPNQVTLYYGSQTPDKMAYKERAVP